MNIVNSLKIFSLLALMSGTAAYAEVRKVEIDKDKSLVKWVGKKVTGQHDGVVKIKEGHVEMDGENIVGGKFVLDMTSITNKDLEDPGYKTKLENHLKSEDFFNVTKFPETTYEIKEVKKDASGKSLINGELTVKGIKLPLSFPAAIKKEGEAYAANSKLVLDRTKWDIRYNSGKWFDPQTLGDKLIYDDIDIEINAVTK